jgi:ubiquinone/menaquinone biosynthesis C-methylase UbiE
MRQSSPNLNCRMASLGWRTAVSYAALAPVYDALLGDRFFLQLRRVFDWLVQCYGIRFRSAADVACGTGTFVRYLRERGVPVVYGVDHSLEMLRVAITKNQGTGARFLLQEFATLQLPQPVDLIHVQYARSFGSHRSGLASSPIDRKIISVSLKK